jgi:hypothetical protein
MKLRKLSLFGAVAGALMLTAVLAPRANATLLVYYNFNQGALTFPASPYLSVAPGSEIGINLSNTASAGHAIFRDLASPIEALPQQGESAQHEPRRWRARRQGQ